MSNVTLNRTLDATQSQVWAVLADFPNIADWNSGIKKSYSTNDSIDGVGAMRHCDLAPLGSLKETVVGWTPEEQMVISIDSAAKLPIKGGQMTFTLARAGESTDFTMSYDYTANGRPFKGLVAKILQGQLRKGFNGFIDDLEPAAKSQPVG
ncbi:MAG: carbon monoxide dehydrogenase subunit G [Myxococcota bacterium]|jgi:carbon monoxide dehydrogenase subunit G